MFYLSAHDIQKVISAFGKDAVMDAVIHSLSCELKEYDPEQVWMPVREGFYDAGLTEWMPVHKCGDSTTLKVVSYFPKNPEVHEKSTIQAMLSRISGDTGQILEVAEGTLLTALRTGAASALASQVLAHPDSKVLGLVGCGAQCITQAHAICRLFPISKILTFDACPEAHASVVDRLSFLNISIQPSALSQVEAEADILCTATTVGVGAPPVITGTNLKRHVHINAVGSDYPGKRELPETLVRSAFIVPDHFGQAVREGECQQLEDSSPPHGLHELHELIRNADHFRGRCGRQTIFDSTGLALEDVSVLSVISDFARRAGIGRTLEFESEYADPKDIYSGCSGQSVSHLPQIDMSVS